MNLPRMNGKWAATSPALRIEARSIPEPMSGCVLWLGAVTRRGGHGLFRLVDGRQTSVHRVAWEIKHGPVPKRLCVCHKCDVPSCVNTAHMFLGTHRENGIDRDRKGRNAHANKTHCRRGHEFNEKNTYRHKGKRGCRACNAHHQRVKASKRIQHEVRP